jgi:hypothetical protein
MDIKNHLEMTDMINKEALHQEGMEEMNLAEDLPIKIDLVTQHIVNVNIKEVEVNKEALEDNIEIKDFKEINQEDMKDHIKEHQKVQQVQLEKEEDVLDLILLKEEVL